MNGKSIIVFVILFATITKDCFAESSERYTDKEIKGFLGYEFGDTFEGSGAISVTEQYGGLTTKYELTVDDRLFEKVTIFTNQDNKIYFIRAFNEQKNCKDQYEELKQQLHDFYSIAKPSRDLNIRYEGESKSVRMSGYCFLQGLSVKVSYENDEMRKLREEIQKNKEEVRASLPVCAEADGYQRPYTWGWMSSKFGMRSDPFTGKKAWHNGVDFAGKVDSLVYASSSGIVLRAEDADANGLRIELKHDNNDITSYSHLNEILVSVGQLVTRGQPVGKMGSTGRSTGPHVGYELIRDGEYIDPVKYFVDETMCNSVYLDY